MKLKSRIWLTVGWLVLTLGLSAAALAYVVHDSPSQRQAEERAAKLGSGAGIVVALGCAALWLPWAWEYGRQNRERQQKLRDERKRNSRKRR